MMNKEIIIGGVAVAAVGFAVAAFKKVSSLCRRLGKSLDEIESKTSINVADEIVDDVVERVTERYFNKVVPAKVDATIIEIKKEAVKNISNEIHDKVDEFGPEIRTNLRNQVGDVDIEKFKKQAIEETIQRTTKQLLAELQNAKADALKAIAKERDDLIRAMKDDVREDTRKMKNELREFSEKAYRDAVDDMTIRMKDQCSNINVVWSALANKMGV